LMLTELLKILCSFCLRGVIGMPNWSGGVFQISYGDNSLKHPQKHVEVFMLTSKNMQ